MDGLLDGQGGFTKIRDRALPTFGNINLLGKCNVDCYFCLGKDIESLLSQHDQTQVHFSQWKNFDTFLEKCGESNIKKIYITGQNTDALVYKYLSELIIHLKNNGFMVGMRTNGYLAPRKMDAINLCNLSVGYSIHTLDPEKNWNIMKRRDIPNWEKIIPATNGPRVQIVVNRYNKDEIESLIEYAAQFSNVKYIQVRRICTDTRADELALDAEIYEDFYNKVKNNYLHCGNYFTAEIFDMFGKPTCFWRTVKTTVNSFNYFTNGTVDSGYFVVEGFRRHNEEGFNENL